MIISITFQFLTYSLAGPDLVKNAKTSVPDTQKVQEHGDSNAGPDDFQDIDHICTCSDTKVKNSTNNATSEKKSLDNDHLVVRILSDRGTVFDLGDIEYDLHKHDIASLSPKLAKLLEKEGVAEILHFSNSIENEKGLNFQKNKKGVK